MHHVGGRAVALLLSLALVGCSGSSTAAGDPFEPAHTGTLTVATAVLPAPGFWVGPKGGPYGGFEADLAAALAADFDLEVKVIHVPFGDLVAGKLGGADLALSQLTPTDEREEVVDFSTPYVNTAPTVLASRTVDDADADDALGLKELRWVALNGSTMTSVIDDRIRPDDDAQMVGSRSEQLDAIRSGRADACLLDLPVALALARSEPDQFHVVGQLSGDEGLAAALPEGSANVDAIDAAIKSLKADGTLDELSERWFGETGSDVPLIRVKE